MTKKTRPLLVLVANPARPEGDTTGRAALKLVDGDEPPRPDDRLPPTTFSDPGGVVKGDACADCGEPLDLTRTMFRASGGGLRCAACEENPGRTRIFFSRFPDAQPPAELVTVHPHLLERGRCLVVEWAWNPTENTYEQRAVINVPSIENAREYAPPGAAQIQVPAEFALEAYEVRS